MRKLIERHVTLNGDDEGKVTLTYDTDKGREQIRYASEDVEGSRDFEYVYGPNAGLHATLTAASAAADVARLVLPPVTLISPDGATTVLHPASDTPAEDNPPTLNVTEDAPIAVETSVPGGLSVGEPAEFDSALNPVAPNEGSQS